MLSIVYAMYKNQTNLNTRVSNDPTCDFISIKKPPCSLKILFIDTKVLIDYTFYLFAIHDFGLLLHRNMKISN